MQNMKDRTLSGALRAAADLTDALHPLREDLYVSAGYRGVLAVITAPEERRAEALAAATRIVKAHTVDGKVRKDYRDGNLSIEGSLGAEFTASLFVTATCEAKVVRTERKTVKRLVTPAVYEDVEEDVEVVEWECAPTPVLTAEVGA